MIYLLYIDPGTGSMLFQILIAGAITTGIFFRKFLVHPFKIVLKKLKKNPENES